MNGSPIPSVVVLDTFSSGLAIARRMGRLGAEVHLLAEWASPETRTRHAQAHVLPLGPAWIDALARIAERCPDAVVIPGTDRAVELLIAHRDRLAPTLRLFERDSAAHLALMAKDSADAIARGAGVAVPYTAVLETLEDLSDVAQSAPWPCVVKPVSAEAYNTAVGGRQRTRLARDAGEAERLLREPFAAGLPMLLCQYVPGTDGDVEEAIVVRLADGSFPVHFGVHKLRQNPPGFGHTALGDSAGLPEATEIARRVLDAAGFVGVAGVEVKRDTHTGERYFLEVNVRIPNQWGLGDACGVDATRRLVAALAGEPLGPQPVLRPGVRFVAVEMDVRLLLDRLAEVPMGRRPALAARHLRPWLGAGERSVLSLRDPAPALSWLRTAAGAIRRGRLEAEL